MSVLITRGSTGAARARNFTSKMEMLISILSERGVRIVPGASPATDCKNTVYMPWIRDDATEKDFLKYFCSAAHEQAHLLGKSDPSATKGKAKFLHFCVNAVEDIRVEQLQEKEYPGLVGYRKRELVVVVEEYLNKEFAGATRENPSALVVALLKYMIVINRARQLGEDDLRVLASKDILECYDTYLKDLEEICDELNDFRHALNVGEVVYKRLKDLLIDDEKDKRKKEKSKEESDEEEESDEDGEDGDGGDGDSESSEGKSKSKKSEPDDEDSEESEGSEGSESEDKPKEDKKPKGSESDKSEDESEEESDEDESEGGSDGESDEEESEEESESDEEREAREEEERKAEEKEIRKKVEEMLDEMSEEDLKTIADKVKDEVTAIAAKDPGAYYTENGVKDIVRYEEPNLASGMSTLTKGRALLGSVGSKLTKLFVSQTRERQLYNQKGGRFDMKSFNADAMDRRTDIYSTRTPGSLDKAAVCFAVDNSGSMRGVKIQKAYQILSGLLYYLDKAGIPTEAIGFTAETSRSEVARTHAVTHTIIKTYDETFNKKAISRCYPPRYLMENVELEALRFLAPRLNQRPEGKKIMLVLSDGAPAFGPDALNRKMAKAYIEYIKSLRAHGFYVIGFGIDTDVSEYFGKDCVNTDTANLGDAITKKLTEILNTK